MLQIYTINSFLLNVVFFVESMYYFFEDKCLKMKLLIDTCTVLCRISKMHRLADLNIGHCVELTFSEGNFPCSTVVKPSYRENDKSPIGVG